MKRRSLALASTLVLAIVSGLAAGCGEPVFMLPGGELTGTLKPVPGSWKFSDAHEDVQLETRPGDPYSVNVWGVGIGKRFFVAAARGLESEWARNIEADPNVRLRIGDDVFELRAERTDDWLDRRRFLATIRHKYDDYEPDGDEMADAILYVLGPR